MVELWEKQKGETEKAYQAFCIYREMGPGRSLTAVAKTLKKSVTAVHRYSHRKVEGMDWEMRVQAYDNKRAQIDLKVYEDKTRDAFDRCLRIGQGLQALAIKGLNELKNSNDKLKPAEIIALAQVGIELERKGLGQPDNYSVIEQKVKTCEVTKEEMDGEDAEKLALVVQTLAKVGGFADHKTSNELDDNDVSVEECKPNDEDKDKSRSS